MNDVIYTSLSLEDMDGKVTRNSLGQFKVVFNLGINDLSALEAASGGVRLSRNYLSVLLLSGDSKGTGATVCDPFILYPIDRSNDVSRRKPALIISPTSLER